MDKFKRGYKQAKGKVKDLLRPPSSQSALTTPARSPRSSQEPSGTRSQGMSSTTSAIALAIQAAITSTAVDTPGADVSALEVPAPGSSSQPEHAPHAASTYAQPLSVTPKSDNVESVCNDLLTVMHGASDAFPLLKWALVEILEIWRQCEVRQLPPLRSFLGLITIPDNFRG